MNKKNEPCSICEDYIDGVICDKDKCPVGIMKKEFERYKHIRETVDNFWSELEKLSMLKGKDTPTLEELLEYIEQAKSEAYREFWLRLKTDYGRKMHGSDFGGEFWGKAILVEDGDNLLNELIGESK